MQEYLHVSAVCDWTEGERLAARAAVRGVMVRLRLYSRFCDRLEASLSQEGAAITSLSQQG